MRSVRRGGTGRCMEHDSGSGLCCPQYYRGVCLQSSDMGLLLQRTCSKEFAHVLDLGAVDLVPIVVGYNRSLHGLWHVSWSHCGTHAGTQRFAMRTWALDNVNNL